MKNGIIINGKQFELQHIQVKDEYVCGCCDLSNECDDYSYGITLCELLHNADEHQAYRYIGKEELIK